MLSIKQRKTYAIAVGVLFLVGLFIYGLLVGDFAQEKGFIVVLMSLLGGMMIGGLASGAFIVIRFIASSKSTVLIVFSCVLFIITLLIIFFIGIYSLIPYYIYNLLIILKLKKCNDMVELKRFVKITRFIVIGVLVIIVVLSFVALMIYNQILNVKDNKVINEEIGYPVGSPDYYIIKNYYYSKYDADYADNMQYTYDVKDGALFALIEKENVIYDICEFNYYSDLPFDDYNSYMADLFSSTYVLKSKDVFAVTLVIDARSEEEHRAELAEFYGKKKVSDLLLNTNMDRKFADPDKIKIYNKNDKIVPLKSQNGRFIMFYATCKKGDTDFELKAIYDGQEAVILTYDDIANYSSIDSVTDSSK